MLGILCYVDNVNQVTLDNVNLRDLISARRDDVASHQSKFGLCVSPASHCVEVKENEKCLFTFLALNEAQLK